MWLEQETTLLQLELVLRPVLPDFYCPEDWSLPQLGTQNVLFDVREWRVGMAGTAECCAEWVLDAIWTQKVLAGEPAFHELDPSLGSVGYGVARTVMVAYSWEPLSKKVT